MQDEFMFNVKRESKKMYLNNIFMSCFKVIILGIYSQMISNLVRDVTNSKFNSMETVVRGLMQILVVGFVLAFFWEYYTNIKIENVKQKLKLSFYNCIGIQSLSALSQIKYGQGKERISDDFERITDFHMWEIPNLVVSIFTVVFYTVLLINDNGIVLVTLSVLAFIQCVAPIIINKFVKVNYTKMRQVEEELTDYIVFSYTGYETMKIYALEKLYIHNLKKIHKRYVKAGVNSEVAVTVENIMDNFLENMLNYGSYAIIGLYVLRGVIDVHLATQAIVLSSSLFVAYKNIFDTIPQYGIYKVAEGRITGWLKKYKSTTDNINDEVGQFCIDSLLIENKEGIVVLEIENIKWDMKKKYIIFGDNGSGKSTLLKIMVKEMEYKEGQIKYDNIELKNISDNCLLDKVFYLPQQDVELNITPIELYKYTCHENAAEIAIEFGIMEKMLKEEKISDLSLGNKRKVFLALAFSQNDKYLFLDEPTNHLDTYGINILKKKINEYQNGVFIVTHEKELFEVVDFQYEIRGGKIKWKN